MRWARGVWMWGALLWPLTAAALCPDPALQNLVRKGKVAASWYDADLSLEQYLRRPAEVRAITVGLVFESLRYKDDGWAYWRSINLRTQSLVIVQRAVGPASTAALKASADKAPGYQLRPIQGGTPHPLETLELVQERKLTPAELADTYCAVSDFLEAQALGEPQDLSLQEKLRQRAVRHFWTHFSLYLPGREVDDTPNNAAAVKALEGLRKLISTLQ